MFKFVLKKQPAQVNLRTMASENGALNDETINISQFPFLYATPERKLAQETTCIASINRINSSFSIKKLESPPAFSCSTIECDDQHNATNNAFANQLCDSLLCSTALECTASICSDSSSHLDNSMDTLEANEANDNTSEQFHSVNASFFNETAKDTQDVLYVCCQSFLAKNSCQISLAYSDVVSLVYINGEQCLVQNKASGKRGYVPKENICKLNQAWISKESFSL